MRIGELAQQAGTSTKAIRYYEDIGVLAEPNRTGSGYRDYDQTAAERLGFVKAAQSAGLTLAEIRSIFDIRDRGDSPCSHVADLIERKLAETEERMSALQQTRRELEVLASRAERLEPGDCSAEGICNIIIPS